MTSSRSSGRWTSADEQASQTPAEAGRLFSTWYTFWHFGKPCPEAIGAAIAAYTLGVIALRTRSIAGGIIIHIGVALLMELAAYLQHYGRT